MKRFRLFLFVVATLAFGSLSAQDIHFSLYNMSPLTLNPAHTGAFSGTIRIGGIYRDQWASFLGNQFVTPSFYIDSPIIRGFRDNDWVGVGMAIYSDEAGTSRLQTSATMFSAAYHLGLNKKGTSILTLGLQGGNVQRRVRFGEGTRFEDELPDNIGGGGLGQGNSVDRNNSDERKKSYNP